MGIILIVDDEPAILSSLAAVIEANGHHVMTAPNGSEALQVAAVRKPDVVVSDCLMPVTDGPGLYKLFQANPSLRAVPFIFMSGTETPASLPKAPFFEKPFDANRMIETIGVHMAERVGTSVAPAS